MRSAVVTSTRSVYTVIVFASTGTSWITMRPMKSSFGSGTASVYRMSTWSPAEIAPPAAFASGILSDMARNATEFATVAPGGRTAICPSVPVCAIFVGSTGSFLESATVVIMPGRGAPTCPGLFGSAFKRSAALALSERSRTVTSRG